MKFESRLANRFFAFNVNDTAQENWINLTLLIVELNPFEFYVHSNKEIPRWHEQGIITGHALDVRTFVREFRWERGR
jgi:hypothetical protein